MSRETKRAAQWATLLARLPIPAVLRRHSAEAMFAAGVAFDFLTIQRIDAWTDLALQWLYLAGLTGLLIYQHRDAIGAWTPAGRLAPLWRYNVEALHFLYGGLLSAYAVLYFRSSTAARPAVFLALIAGVMAVNEVPRVRRLGYPLRLGLYAFCVLSFLNYFIPIVLGRIDGWVFLTSLLTSAAIVWPVAGVLVTSSPDRAAARKRLFVPAVAVLACIGALYLLRLIPPVPLSVQFQGIYHDVRRDGDTFTLVSTPAAGRTFWRHDSRPFERRAGDRMFYFARVFAPAGFHHRVLIRWETFDRAGGAWTTTDIIPLEVSGGRADGFRGTAVKANFGAGRWR
ncbi:MAG: hypothetical protein R2708_25140 [Vicinamibacterales bacterium]